jgi:hypothetical protein
MECRRCLLTDQETVIRDGQCEFCHTHDNLNKLSGADFIEITERLRRKKGYQVLIGISGGLDSSYLLWYTVNVLKLKPLVIHFNNGWNDPIATQNMSLLIQKLRVDFLEFHSDDEYDELCGCFLRAGVKDADIPNDIYMTELMRRVAVKYKIKYSFNGHDFRTEGSTPLAWTYMDARYIESVYTVYTGKKLKTFMNYTMWRQIKSALYGIKNIRVFHYITITDQVKRNTMTAFGWKDYGAKHGENIYTKFIGYYLLPNKWGIDKRINYKSALVRSGRLAKNQAKFDLKKGVEFDRAHFTEIERRTGVSVAHALAAPKQTYEDFDHYNFKRWKPVLWVMVKLGLTSYNFYKKYT